MDFMSPWCNTVARSPLQFYHCHSDSDSVPLWVLGHQACHAATCRSAVNMCEGLTRGNLSSTRVSVTVSCLLPHSPTQHPLVGLCSSFNENSNFSALDVILRDWDSEVDTVSSQLGFSTLSFKCLFVCGWQEVKRGIGRLEEWETWRVKGFFLCSGRSETEAYLTAEDCQHLLISFLCMSSFSAPFLFSFQSGFIVSFYNLLRDLLTYFKLLLPLSFFQEFLLCRLFPLSAISISYCPASSPPFLRQSCWMFLVASFYMSLPSYALYYRSLYPDKRLLSWAWRQPG